jgi:hypothetical protein
MANWPLGVAHAGAVEVELVLDVLVEGVISSLVAVAVRVSVIVVLSVVLSVKKLSLVAVAVAVAVPVAVAVRFSTIMEPGAVDVVVTLSTLAAYSSIVFRETLTSSRCSGYLRRSRSSLCLEDGSAESCNRYLGRCVGSGSFFVLR